MAALAVLIVGLAAGCGQLPRTVALQAEAAPASLPPACLGAGLAVALGEGAYAVPIAGETADAASAPAWEAATLQLPPPNGSVTLCSYVADHPTPFSTRGGEDTLVCVAITAAGAATLLGTHLVDVTAPDASCAAVDG